VRAEEKGTDTAEGTEAIGEIEEAGEAEVPRGEAATSTVAAAGEAGRRGATAADTE